MTTANIDALRSAVQFGPFRRVSRDSAAEHLRFNVLYKTFEPYFEAVLAAGNSAEWGPSELRDLYTCRRLSEHAEWSLSDAITGLHLTLSNSQLIGETEAAVLRWLFAANGPRVLTVLGLTGIGKTTLLRYLFFYLPTIIPELNEFVPVHVDMRSTVTQPCEQDVLIAIATALTRTHHFQDGTTLSMVPDTHQVLRELSQDNEPASRVAFDHLITVAARIASPRRLVFILDNVDQLSPEAVGYVLNTARILDIRHRIHAAVAMRPTVFWSDVEHHLDREAFVKHSVTVRPPDLGELLSRRLTLSFQGDTDAPSRFLLTARSRIPVELNSQAIERLFTKISGFFLSPEVQTTITCKLCNYDTRRAFTAIRGYLKYRDLPVHEFADEFLLSEVGLRQEQSHLPKRFQCLIQGVMSEDRLYYRERVPDERRRHVILNLFGSGHRDVGVHNVIQYRWLCLLGWKSALVKQRWCIGALQHVGYDSSLCVDALERLLAFGLVVSPQTESVVSRAEQLRITSTGRYYLETLCSEHGYLYNVATDVPLNHLEWAAASPTSSALPNPGQDYRLRVMSLVELFLHVSAAEERELLSRGCSGVPWWSEMLRSTSLLSTQLMRGIEQLLSNGTRSSRRGIAAAAQRIVDQHSGILRKELTRIESLLTSRFQSAGTAPFRQDVFTTPLVDSTQGYLTVPTYMDKDRPIALQIRLERGQGSRIGTVGAFVDVDHGEMDDGQSPCLTFSGEFPDVEEKEAGRVLIRRTGGDETTGVSGRILYTSNGHLIGEQPFAIPVME